MLNGARMAGCMIKMEVVKDKDLTLLRVARGGDKVYKDECVYCFNSPVSMKLSQC